MERTLSFLIKPKTLIVLIFIFFYPIGHIAGWSDDSAVLKKELEELLEKNGQENFLKDRIVVRTPNQGRLLAVTSSGAMLVGDRFFDAEKSDELRLMFLLHELGHLHHGHVARFYNALFCLNIGVGIIAAVGLNMIQREHIIIGILKKALPFVCMWGSNKMSCYILSFYSRAQEFEADEFAIAHAPSIKHRIAYLEYFTKCFIETENYEKEILNYIEKYLPSVRPHYFSFLQWKWDPEHPKHSTRYYRMKEYILKHYPGEIEFSTEE